MVTIIRASEADLPEVVPLFDQYRVFYKQESDLRHAEEFLRERMGKEECIIYLARHNGHAAGFVLLYTSFSSVSMRPFYILNDLYVRQEFRQRGVGQKLLQKTKELCLESDYKGLALETATDNPAQKLYEKLGWKKDTHCFHYFWTAPQ